MEAWRDDLNAGLARLSMMMMIVRTLKTNCFCNCFLLLRMRLRGNLFIDQKVVVVNLGGSMCFVIESITMTSSTVITFLRDQPLEL